mmetsp:Transcript_44990/g.88514  ORF Transcript_44990/g.88514 Transcript_44990/m.88514 type:complete len:102 (-) Transcript_44990:20-325(-)
MVGHFKVIAARDHAELSQPCPNTSGGQRGVPVGAAAEQPVLSDGDGDFKEAANRCSERKRWRSGGERGSSRGSGRNGTVHNFFTHKTGQQRDFQIIEKLPH